MKLKKIVKITLAFIILAIIILGISLLFGKEEQEKDEQGKVYSIKNADFYLYQDVYDREDEYRGVKLLEYDDTAKDYAEIYCILYDYNTDGSVYYAIKVEDETNHSLLIDEQEDQQIMGGIVASAKIKKMPLNSKINFSMLEKDVETKKIVKKESVKIDLEKNLEEKIKIDQTSNLIDGELGDIKFKYINNQYAYFGETSHAYSSNLIGKSCSLPIEMQYGNRFATQEHIELSYDKNVNNLTLEQAFESFTLINENFGQYGLSDVYGIDISNGEGEVVDTIIIDFEEMIKLCKGQEIEKNGKKYTKDSFERYAEMKITKEGVLEICDGIKAIKFNFDQDNSQDCYMFIYKDNIYQLKIPREERIKDEVNQFLGSLKPNE